jgi:hypothetical protein
MNLFRYDFHNVDIQLNNKTNVINQSIFINDIFLSILIKQLNDFNINSNNNSNINQSSSNSNNLVNINNNNNNSNTDALIEELLEQQNQLQQKQHQQQQPDSTQCLTNK